MRPESPALPHPQNHNEPVVLLDRRVYARELERLLDCGETWRRHLEKTGVNPRGRTDPGGKRLWWLAREVRAIAKGEHQIVRSVRLRLERLLVPSFCRCIFALKEKRSTHCSNDSGLRHCDYLGVNRMCAGAGQRQVPLER
jgi:hypothetical protein